MAGNGANDLEMISCTNMLLDAIECVVVVITSLYLDARKDMLNGYFKRNYSTAVALNFKACAKRARALRWKGPKSDIGMIFT